MRDLIVNSAYFGVIISLIGFFIGLALKNKYKLAIFNPILISVILVIALLLFLKIDYPSYYNSAKYLSYFLTPATVSLAIPLYKQLALLKKHKFAILIGITAGVIANMVSIYLLALVFGLSHKEYVTLLPKSITTAIGMGVSEEFGGYVTITVAVIVITGIFGNMIGVGLCKLIGLKSPIAKGVALGTASHAIGTSKAMEMGEVEGAMGSLSIVVCGMITLLGVSIFANLI